MTETIEGIDPWAALAQSQERERKMRVALKLALASRWLSIDFDHNRTHEACDVRHAMIEAAKA